MIKKKIEIAKKKLAELWGTQQITSDEYRQAIIELEERANTYTQTQPIKVNLEENKKAKRIPEANSTDLDYFEEGVLIPRHIYDKNKEKFKAKAMYSAFYILCKHANSNGVVTRLTTDDMAKNYGYSDSRNIRNAVDKLETVEIITVNRNIKPHIYTINNYHFKAGGFVVPEKTIKDIKTMRLKQLRLEWLYMCRNLHSPRNRSKFNLSLGHIRKVVNAGSYKEVLELADSLKNKFFTEIKEITGDNWRSFNRLKVDFNKKILGIVREAKDVLFSLSDSIKSKLDYIFDSLELKTSNYNYNKAVKLMNKYSEYELMVVEQNVKSGRIEKSNTGSINYLKKWLKLARNGAIVIQY